MKTKYKKGSMQEVDAGAIDLEGLQLRMLSMKGQDQVRRSPGAHMKGSKKGFYTAKEKLEKTSANHSRVPDAKRHVIG